MSVFDALLKHTRKTQTILTSLKHGAAGWKIGKHNPEHLEGPTVGLYLYDRPTDWAWVGIVPLESFHQATRTAQANPNLWEALRGGLAHVASNVANGTPVPDQCGHDWEEQLAIFLAAYAGTTQVLRLAEGLPAGGHFIVLNYRASREQHEGILRPVVLPGPVTDPLGSAEFTARLRQVMAIDRGNHPEWFR